MADTLLVSDLHLSPQRPLGIRLFLNFLQQQAATAQRLFILGDLFDAWIGDDNQAAPIPQIIAALRTLSDSGTELLLMHGNRDFLIGDQFATMCGCTLLADPTVVNLAGTPTLLMHGDLLCTDDTEYQKARHLLRNPAFIADLLSKPIKERIALAAEYRKRSGEATSLKADGIMDVNQGTVEHYLREQGVRQLIHGHTHRPATHRFQLDGTDACRWVLPEWHEDRGGLLRVTSTEIIAEPVS